jgi:hypothetical protein
LSFADMINVAMMAARSAPRSEPRRRPDPHFAADPAPGYRHKWQEVDRDATAAAGIDTAEVDSHIDAEHTT